MSTLGNLHNLSLLEQLTNSSTSTRTIDLKTVDNSVNRNEFHLPIINKSNKQPSAPQQPVCRNQPARNKPCYRQSPSPFPYSISNQINPQHSLVTFLPLLDYNRVSIPFITIVKLSHNKKITYHDALMYSKRTNLDKIFRARQNL